MLNISRIGETVNVYYSLDNNNWNRLATISDVSCKDLGVISVVGGSTLYLAMMTGSSTHPNIGNGVGTDVDTSFLASNTANCLLGKANTTVYCGITSPYSLYIIQDTSISLGAIIDPNTYTLQDCGSGNTQRLTPTPSTSPGQYFSASINIASSLGDVCANNYNVTTISSIGSDTLFCTSQQFFSPYFSTVPQGIYYISYNNYVMSVQTDGVTNFASVIDTCTLCASIPVTPTPTVTPTPSVSVGSTVTVTSFGAKSFNCLFPNDYIGYYVNLNTSISEDTTFFLSIIQYNSNNEYVSTNNIPVLVPAGSTSNIYGNNPCEKGGIYSGGNSIYSVCMLNIISGSTFIYNPFGWCSGPDATPSITPSVTPTISVTPSVTPSITPTISVTPSITKTPSPTPSVASNFTVINDLYGTFDISAVVAVQESNPTFYAIKTGSYPVTNGNTLVGHINYTVTGPIKVTVANYVGSYGLTLYKNGILQQCISVGGNGDYTFSTVSYNNTTDTMTIKAEKAC
jgi:hypothetical protein